MASCGSEFGAKRGLVIGRKGGFIEDVFFFGSMEGEVLVIFTDLNCTSKSPS